jgi:uncharacterized Ntn-hydrolase superfamily protein
MTYSIVARDSLNGELGVAVQSHYFSVGPVVPWVEAGVGAVATQAFAEIAHGPSGLDLMRAGKTAEEALDMVLLADPESARRQVAMVDATGKVAAHTGKQCIAHAGHRVCSGVSVQANMMERDTVPDAMLAAFEATSGELADRLLAALDAAEHEGGDIRGKQSAAIVVAAGERGEEPWRGRLMDLRVEDHTDPLIELRRLVQLHRAYGFAGAAERAAAAGDMAAAASSITQAMQVAPGNAEIAFWAAIGAAMGGQIPLAKQLLAQAVAVDPRWKELVRRLPASGTFPLSEEAIRELTGG